MEQFQTGLVVEQAMLRQSNAAAANNGALSEDKPEFHSDCHSCEDCLLFRLSYLGTCLYIKVLLKTQNMPAQNFNMTSKCLPV